MKKLIFIRHGKAEDESAGITDFERSLTVKGKMIAGLMAGKLMEKEKGPVVILTSPAFRALETALIFAAEFGLSAEKIKLKSSMYLSMNFQDLPALLSELPEETETVMFFGHNPSFTHVANMLTKDGCDMIPKTGIICISFKARTWSEISRNSGTIEYFLKPEKVL
jgi:phosphohistidine phosphatase